MQAVYVNSVSTVSQYIALCLLVDSQQHELFKHFPLADFPYLNIPSGQ